MSKKNKRSSHTRKQLSEEKLKKVTGGTGEGFEWGGGIMPETNPEEVLDFRKAIYDAVKAERAKRK